MKNFVFLGDSITDAGRLWLPETNGLGNGYVKLLAERFSKDPRFLPSDQISAASSGSTENLLVINKGHDGFTLPFLLRNLNTDCLAFQPFGVSVLVGINDVGVAQNTGKSLQDQAFASNYETLIRRLLAASIPHIFLLGPFLFSRPQEYLNWFSTVLEAESIVEQLANQYRLPFLPLQSRMQKAETQYGTEALTPDGIHLTLQGHQLLADWWQEAFTNLPGTSD